MVFAIGLIAVTALAPAASVVTTPMLTEIGAGAAGAAAGAGAGIAGATAGAAGGAAAAGAAGAAAGAAGAGAAGTAVVQATASVTGGLLTGVNAALGPPGWIVLGKSESSWDCWKKVIHDTSDNKDGVPLSFILEHDSIKSVCSLEDHYIVENIWEEKFKIYFVQLPNGEIAAHAE